MENKKVMMSRTFLAKEFISIGEMLNFLNDSNTIVPVSVLYVDSKYSIIYCELIPVVPKDEPIEIKP